MLTLDSFPHPGDFTVAEQAVNAISGSFPVAKAATRMGAQAVIATPMGDGPFAHNITTLMHESGIRHIGPVSTQQDNGYRVILNDGEKKTYIKHFGAETIADAHLYDPVRPETGDVVHILGVALLHSTAQGIRRFLDRPESQPDARQFRLIITPTSRLGDADIDTVRALAAAKPIWSMNRQEATTLADNLGITIDETLGMRISGGFDDRMFSLCEQLGNALGSSLVLRGGSHGVWIKHVGHDVQHVPGFETKGTHIRSAGPCHTGALCAALAHGMDLQQAAQLANAAASLAIQHNRHGIPICPTFEEADALVTDRNESHA
ncbi:kinase, PfkB family [Bifidobacterium gallicum DSM 20093 = LMG 11596]|nr:kinase, PfkB family [Bifidobacterium gallicum DSM 20093 = LMG 11596]